MVIICAIVIFKRLVVLDFKLHIACPDSYTPDAEIVAAAGKRMRFLTRPNTAAKNADLIVTDVWASMGQEEEQRAREIAFKDYQITQAALQAAHPDALFMHCLPAHRGEEASAEVIDGAQSVIFQEAENRLHAQKALLELLMCPKFVKIKL